MLPFFNSNRKMVAAIATSRRRGGGILAQMQFNLSTLRRHCDITARLCIFKFRPNFAKIPISGASTHLPGTRASAHNPHLSTTVIRPLATL